MEVCIAHIRGKPVMLALRQGLVTIDAEVQPIKGVTEEHLADFAHQISAIPYAPDPGYRALINARRTAFLAFLLGRAVGDECVSLIGHILDHVHMDVLEYLGEDIPQ